MHQWFTNGAWQTPESIAGGISETGAVALASWGTGLDAFYFSSTTEMFRRSFEGGWGSRVSLLPPGSGTDTTVMSASGHKLTNEGRVDFVNRFVAIWQMSSLRR